MMHTATRRAPRPKLADLHEDSTLAEIRYALMNADQSVPHVTGLDAKFTERPDYQCWRALCYMKNEPRYRDEYFTGALHHGNQALGDDNEMIRWGAIGTIVRTLLSGKADHLWKTHSQIMIDMATRCTALARHPNRWSLAPASCAYLDLMCRWALDRFNDWSNVTHTIESAGAHLDGFAACVKEIDRRWNPGVSADLSSSLRDERLTVPFDGMTDIENLLGNAFYASRTAASEACGALEHSPANAEAIRRLLNRAVQFGRSGWLTHRAVRRGANKFIEAVTATGVKPTGWYSSESRDAALNIELQALRGYASAMRDAGDDFGAARSNWMLLAFANSTLVENATLQNLLNDWLNYSTMGPLNLSCDQVGLTVPGRAPSNLPPKSAEQSAKTWTKNLETAQPFCPSYPTHRSGSGGSKKPDAYRRRLLADYATSTDWGLLKCYLRPPEDVDPHEILKNAKNWWQWFCNGKVNDHPPPNMLQAAFRLCLKYNRIDTANYFLKCAPDGQGRQNGNEAHGWLIQGSELLDFAKAACHASAILPMGLDFDKHEFWRQRMLRVCSVLRDDLSSEQTLLLHEAVHGCCNALCARSQIADDLCSYFESLEDGVWDRSDRALQVTWKPPEPQQIGEFLQALSIPGQGAPIAVSIASLREAGLSVCGVGPDGSCAVDWIEGVNDKTCETELADALDGCDRADRFLPKDCPSVVKVAAKVAEMVGRLAPNASWIALSVDTGLASIPWNLLMPALKCQSPVAVVPSLGWLGTLREPRRVQPSFKISPRDALVLPTFVQSQIEGIDRLLSQIKSDEKAHSQSFVDVATIVGHGCQTGHGNDAFQTVQFGKEKMSQPWWLAVAEKHDALVVHGCLTGRVGQRLLRDLSGVPGMALLAGASLIISPVIEIGADAALVLQRHLMMTTVSDTIAQRYQRALKECPSVGLYNLYGVPSRPFAATRSK